jgi:ureidoacrylate peracid hydrolase
MSSTSQVTVDRGVISVAPRPMADRPPGMGRPLVMTPIRTAVVVVDMQRYFLETPPFSGMRTILEPTAAFLVAARQAGLAVVHVRSEFSEGMENAGRIGSRTRAMMDSLGTGLVHGSPLADIAPELRRAAEDIVVTKTRFSGFCHTDLDSVLRKRQIDTLIFAGGTTTVCVESTLRDALFLEYNALVLADCTEDMTPDLHRSALQRIDMFFGWVCESTELVAALQRVAQAIQVQ